MDAIQPTLADAETDNGIDTIIIETEDTEIVPSQEQTPITKDPNEPIFIKPAPSVQMTLFPTEQEQQETIRLEEQAELAAIPIVITAEDIDNALIARNGDLESKLRVFEYMGENARARETKDFLKSEFGNNQTDFVVTKDGADPKYMSWGRAQRWIADLIENGSFLTDLENTTLQQRAITKAAQEQAGDIPTGLATTKQLADCFRLSNNDNATLLYAKDEDGTLHISNRYLVVKPLEQDIEVLTAQLSELRNSDRRRKTLPVVKTL